MWKIITKTTLWLTGLSTFVGAASSRDNDGSTVRLEYSRLEAAPTTNTTCFFQITGFRISVIGNYLIIGI